MVIVNHCAYSQLGYSNSLLFTRGPVRFLSLDSISFARPVPIGSVLRLKSYVLHTDSTAQFPALIVGCSLTNGLASVLMVGNFSTLV